MNTLIDELNIVLSKAIIIVHYHKHYKTQPYRQVQFFYHSHAPAYRSDVPKERFISSVDEINLVLF